LNDEIQAAIRAVDGHSFPVSTRLDGSMVQSRAADDLVAVEILDAALEANPGSIRADPHRSICTHGGGKCRSETADRRALVTRGSVTEHGFHRRRILGIDRPQHPDAVPARIDGDGRFDEGHPRFITLPDPHAVRLHAQHADDAVRSGLRKLPGDDPNVARSRVDFAAIDNGADWSAERRRDGRDDGAVDIASLELSVMDDPNVSRCRRADGGERDQRPIVCV
jgi:hypothetical protein